MALVARQGLAKLLSPSIALVQQIPAGRGGDATKGCAITADFAERDEAQPWGLLATGQLVNRTFGQKQLPLS